MLDSRVQSVNPLTFEEHRELGQELLKARSRLLHLSVVIVSEYGPQSRPAFSFNKMMEAMDKLCLDMQTQAELDCPGLDASSLYR